MTDIDKNKANNIHFDESEISKMWENILKGALSKPHSRSYLILNKYFRIAAVFIGLLILISLYFIYSHINPPVQQVVKLNESFDEAVLILSDGSEHLLETNNSHIEYTPDGDEILINQANKQIEKISNQKGKSASLSNQIIVPFGRRHSLTLSDGTSVKLNSGSILVFPSEFTGNTRKVFLKGEGFFIVSENASMPFIVQTDFMDIKVTGTQFNVSSYEDETIASTALVEGNVEVTIKNKQIFNPRYSLESGQLCSYNTTDSKSTIGDVDLTRHISWIYGWIMFKDQPLKSVIKKVERYYNKNIVIENVKDLNAMVSGKLILTEEFENVVTNLATILEADLEVTPDGNFIIKKDIDITNY